MKFGKAVRQAKKFIKITGETFGIVEESPDNFQPHHKDIFCEQNKKFYKNKFEFISIEGL